MAGGAPPTVSGRPPAETRRSPIPVAPCQDPTPRAYSRREVWSSIELREIRVFLTLAEELHFGRAADRLGLTHSRVSQVIRALESRLGGRLFERGGRQVMLTPLGDELQRRIAPIYQQLQQAYLEIKDMSAGATGTLRLGVPHFAGVCPYFSEIISTFETRHADCHVLVTETGFGRDQIDWLRRDQIDILAMRLPVSDPDVVIGPVVAREDRVLAVAANHPLAGRGSVTVEDLADYTTTDIPTFSREVMDVYSPPRTPTGRPIRRVAMQSVTEVMVRVAAGELVHPTVPSIVANQGGHPGIAVVPIRDLAPAETGLIWLAARERPRITAFARAASDVLSSHG
jgi:DNA-binding transcriptional LysR family regulator